MARGFLPLALLALAAFSSCAAANVPAPVTKTNTVRVPALGNRANGKLTMKVTYTDTTATAAVSTGNTIGLGKGFQLRLRTCLAYHLNSRTPVSKCAERNVDTRQNTGIVYTDAPSVALAGQPRPTTQPWGYFTAYTEVLYLNGKSWLMSAHSWPDNGLQGAGIAVAAQEKNSGTLPPSSTVALDGAFTSAVNSGQPDSICTAIPAGPDGSTLPSGVSATHPAFAGAPSYYEVGLPTGAHAGQAPRGVMLIIHGGGWMTTAVGAVQSMRPDADRWRARGWQTVNITYRPCAQSLADVLWFYDRARVLLGAPKICALGTSAGGNLALLIGAYRPDLYCAISQAGPTDLRTIQDELAYDATSNKHDQTLGGRWVHNLGAAAFGEDNLPWFSPAALAFGTLKETRVLQGFSADDAIIPYEQTADLATAMRVANLAAYVDNVVLPIGTIPFGHGKVTQAALDTFYARERQLVAPAPAAAASIPGPGPPSAATSTPPAPPPAPRTPRSAPAQSPVPALPAPSLAPDTRPLAPANGSPAVP